MAYTQAHKDALIEAIATGALSIEYEGKKVVYRSLEHMERTLRAIDEALGSSTSGSSRVVLAEYGCD